MPVTAKVLFDVAAEQDAGDYPWTDVNNVTEASDLLTATTVAPNDPAVQETNRIRCSEPGGAAMPDDATVNKVYIEIRHTNPNGLSPTRVYCKMGSGFIVRTDITSQTLRSAVFDLSPANWGMTNQDAIDLSQGNGFFEVWFNIPADQPNQSFELASVFVKFDYEGAPPPGSGDPEFFTTATEIVEGGKGLWSNLNNVLSDAGVASVTLTPGQLSNTFSLNTPLIQPIDPEARILNLRFEYFYDFPNACNMQTTIQDSAVVISEENLTGTGSVVIEGDLTFWGLSRSDFDDFIAGTKGLLTLIAPPAVGGTYNFQKVECTVEWKLFRIRYPVIF